MRVGRRAFLQTGMAGTVFVASAADISTGVYAMPTRAVREGQLTIHGRMERTQLAFVNERRREFEANLDKGLSELRVHFMHTYDQTNARRR